MQKPCLLLLLLLWLCSESALLRGAVQPVFAPANAPGLEGNGFLTPLDTSAGIITERFQQVYSASLFSAFSEGVGINSFEVRADGPFGNAFDTVVRIEIYLSTTSKAVDGLSSILDENVGADARLIRTREPFLISGGGGGSGPHSWLTLADIRDNPFHYDPTAGNLLVDMRIYGSPTASPFDAFFDRSDTVSTAYDLFNGPVQLDTGGLATLFVVSPVPEPGTVSLLVVGLVLAGLVGRKGILRKLNAYGPG